MKFKIIKLQNPEYSLQIRETLDGRIFIRDHPDIDIVLIPEENKLITFPKDEINEYVYDSQDVLMKYLTKRGMILPESVEGGQVSFSIEAKIPKSKNNINIVDALIMNIGEFLREENGYFEAEKDYKDDIEKRLHSPDEEESTNFGEVPHAEKKGVIPSTPHSYSFGSGFGPVYEQILESLTNFKQKDDD